ncbi:MAG: ABC transporter six-transmembrane domain-containing protein [Bacteroidota bacterium]
MSLQKIFRRFRLRISLTFLLVLVEGLLAILFPLFIGYAINDTMDGTPKGMILLGALGVASLLFGSLRRFLDSRFYAHIFRELGQELGSEDASPLSEQTARLNMLGELVEFFENSIPQIVMSLIGLGGILFILAAIDLRIFLSCLILLLVVLGVYALSKRKTLQYNTGYNDTMEQQVNVLASRDQGQMKDHLAKLMKWNIKLSDLETVNFAIVWLLVIGLLILAISWAVQHGDIGYVFALVMYVFQYTESVITLPYFYQQWLRLQEISGRLSQVAELSADRSPQPSSC